ncbi:hypothetical protein BX600DRAFT_230253 [Xylariales sp. PMI_506]|nr:hypothetical protein BX600DRAFT_230253 [Xylariales sp. PMI_506]
MVDVMRVPSLGPNMSGSVDMLEVTNRFAETKLPAIHETEELAVQAVLQESRKEQVREQPKKDVYRAPRRAFSSNDYQLPSPATSQPRWNSPSSPPVTKPTDVVASFHIATRTPESSPSTTPSPPTESQLPKKPAQVSLLAALSHGSQLRPALPGPQRSYSVMDYEPIPVLQRPGEKLKLIHLPAELHFAIFDFLDPIDSTCLGLTSKHFYAIHWRMHGTVPLSVRREGPNDMEWAWRSAGPLLDGGIPKESAITKILPRGQVYCRKCGISRCELHRHIADWMGERYEYCEVRQKFGPRAPEDARKKCYRSSPRHPHRCGRHMIQQRAVRLV